MMGQNPPQIGHVVVAADSSDLAQISASSARSGVGAMDISISRISRRLSSSSDSWRPLSAPIIREDETLSLCDNPATITAPAPSFHLYRAASFQSSRIPTAVPRNNDLLHHNGEFEGIEAVLEKILPTARNAPFTPLVPGIWVKLVARFVMDSLERSFESEDARDYKSAIIRARYWSLTLQHFSRGRISPRVLREVLADMCGRFKSLIDAKEVSKANRFVRAGGEFVICVVGTDDPKYIDLAMTASVEAVELGTKSDYSSHLTKELQKLAAHFTLGTENYAMMRARTIAIAGLKFVQKAIKESKEKAVACMVAIIEEVLQRISKSDLAESWIKGLLQWDGLQSLLDVAVSATAALLLPQPIAVQEGLAISEQSITNRALATGIIQWLVGIASTTHQLPHLLDLATISANNRMKDISKIPEVLEQKLQIAVLTEVFEIGKIHFSGLDITEIVSELSYPSNLRHAPEQITRQFSDIIASLVPST
ncbi:hypothetical protein TWF694_006053 [Orbilia ellipsospora]|uniref:Uncharacterized protein n=1 Tax=Orbilia ellipsospora TaxID=2528407 RepID=A0AAV9WR28_9PEZI